MSFLRIHTRAIVIGSIFTLLVVVGSLLVYEAIERWRRDVIRTNETLTKVVAEQLHTASAGVIDSLSATGILHERALDPDRKNALDKRLKVLSDSILERVSGTEGGFFLASMDDFCGYSYPTSPPPIPVYGPPPRSYTFIKNQVLESIETGKAIVKLHQFDPAIFPLATEPLLVDGQAVAVVWARIHIERELPAIKLQQLVNIGALTSLLGFVIALLASTSQRRKIQQMRLELENVRAGEAAHITAGAGTLGMIAHSINAMIKTMHDDITRREQLERQLHQKEKLASLGKVIAGVAHEVKTPLAIMKTRIQMWQQALRDEKRRSQLHEVFDSDSLQLVVDEVDRLSALVKHLLLFSKPQPTAVESVDINDLLKHTIRFSSDPVHEKQIVFKHAFNPDLPTVAADPNALRQVFINILVNAIEAIPKDGTITVKTACSADRKTVVICIEDTGVGIPEDLGQNVFDPFVTTKRKGFGLGLSISYEIVSAHGGTIQLGRNGAGGTTCTIEFPCQSIGAKTEE